MAESRIASVTTEVLASSASEARVTPVAAGSSQDAAVVMLLGP